MQDEPGKVVRLLSAKQSKRARELWDEQTFIDDSDEFDRDMRRLLEEIDRKHARMKQEEAER